MSKPIYIYEGGGRNPHILATIDLDRYSDHDSRALYAVISKRVNNVSTLEVRIPSNCEASKAITNTSDLVLWDSEGKVQEFHITEIDDLEEYSVERYIYAESTLGELITNIVQKGIQPTTTNPKDYLDYILSFTRWSSGTVEGLSNGKWEQELSGLTCLEALMLFIDKYGCEIEVRYETDGKNKIVGRYIDVKKTIGHNYGKRLEDDKDILGLKRHINLGAVKTAIYPRIARNVMKEDGTTHTEYVDISSVNWSVVAGNPVDKPRGQVILTNPDAEDMFKRYNPKDGKLMERIMYAEWTEDTAKDAEDLCRQAWAVLRMNSGVRPSIEINAVDLFRLTGSDPDYYHEQIALGDTCLIVSKAFDPELRVETRVMEMEEDLLNPSNNTYAFGKYRRTLATSNIEQEKSIEDKLNELQNKVQSIVVPEVKPQYQSGRVPYEQIKKQIQNEFMTRSGYVMAEDSDGFWVMDAPSGSQPTHAIILKGGALGIAKYNKVTARWEVGTFIDGTSVNADFINTGKLSAELFEAGSIRTEHLAVATVEYIKAGLATEEELNGVINDLKVNYVTNDSMNNSISDALKGLSISTRNILNRSNVEANTNEYMVKRYTVAELFTVGEEYTITACVTPSEGVVDFSAYVSGGFMGFANLYVKGTKKQVVSSTFRFQKYADGKVPTSTTDRNADVCLYRFPNDGTVKGNSIIHWCVVTKGNQSVLAWIPSPEDTLADIEDAVNKGVLDAEMASKLNAIKDLQRQVKGEYESNLAKANTVYADQYLPAGSTAKTELKTAIDGYTSAYNVYYNHITEMIKDAQVTTEEYNTYVSNSNKYAATLKALSTAVEKANNARLANVYSQARQGLITKAELEVNNNSVIAKAQQGMVSTGAMTEAINFATKDLVNNSEMSNAINGAVSNKVSTDKLNSEITATKIESIKQAYKAITVEYLNNKKQADTLYTNSYLNGIAKTNLNSAISDYTTKYNAVTSAYNDIVNKNTLTSTQANTWNSSITNLQTATTTLAQRMQEAVSNINTNVYTANKNYADGLKATTDKNISDVNKAVSNLRTDVTTTIKDGIINEAEVLSIQSNIKILQAEKADIDKEYTTVYGNSSLTGTPKTNLANMKSAYNTAHTNLINSINNSISDKSISSAEKTDIDNKFTSYNTALGNYRASLQTAISSIADAKSNGAYSSAKSYADGLKKATDASISNVNNAVTNLNNTMNGSFRDSVVDEAEAIAIGKQVDTLNTEKADVDREYNNLYSNGNLTGSPKTNLKSTKDAYNSAHTNLINAINSAIADKKVTSTESSNISSKLSAYNTALGNYRNAVQSAIDNIATNKASGAVNNMVIGDRNYVQNSAFLRGKDKWNLTASSSIDMTCKYNDHPSIKIHHSGLTSSTWQGATQVLHTYGKVKKGDVFTVSYMYYVDSIASFDMPFCMELKGANGALNGVPTVQKHQMKEKVWTKVSFVCTASSDTDYVYAYPWVQMNGTVWFTDIVVRKGNKGGDWIPAPEDTQSAINSAVQGLPTLNDVDSAKNNAIIASKVEVIKQTYKAITNEYNNNIQQANTLYANTYLSGGAKTELNNAKTDYTNKFNALTTSHNNIANDGTLSSAELTAWNNAVTNLQGATTTLARRMQEAITFINTAVYNASKNYTDKTIPDKLTGYAKTSYVDTAKQQAIEAAKKGMVTDTQLQVNTDNILMTTAKMGQYNLLRNTDFRNGTNHWRTWGASSSNGEYIEVRPPMDYNYGGTLSGERNLQIRGSSHTPIGAKNIGVVQSTSGCAVNITYTLSYWINCSECTVKMQVVSFSNGGVATTLTNKTYTNINGGHHRQSWKYDSMSFTTPRDSVRVEVQYSVTNTTSGQFRAYLVKPMLCNGINAQAWTGHPDEIYIGVVSITEEQGIKVEHSNTNTYSTLDSEGLQIWERNNPNPIASFGEGNSAYIGTLTTKSINCENVTPTITLTSDVTIYYSNSGSGNYSGRDSNNCATGFTGAMKCLCDMFGIPNYHVTGGFNVKSNSPQMYKITLKAIGSYLGESIFLECIRGSANLTLEFPSGMSSFGLMYFNDIKMPLVLVGNRLHQTSASNGCMLKRNGNGYLIQDGIMFKHCSNVLVDGFRIISNQDTSYSGISFYNTVGAIRYCDFSGFKQSIWLNHQSICYSKANVGSPSQYAAAVYDSIFNYTGAYPKPTNTGNKAVTVFDSGVAHSVGTIFVYDSVYGGLAQPSVQTLVSTFSPTKYQSVSSYTEAKFYQAAWTSEDWTGQVFFGNALYAFLYGATHISAQIYLERRSSSHGYSTAKVKIDGVDVGTLNLGEGKWFNVPSATIDKIKNGQLDYIPINGKGRDYYIQFNHNAKIKVTCNKTV